jgi:hypothetical protein
VQLPRQALIFIVAAEHLAGFPNVLDLEELATYKGILLYSELDRKFASLKLEL